MSTTRFKKGNVPWNKGKSVMNNTALIEWLKDGNIAGVETRFKKGQVSWNKGTKGLLNQTKHLLKKGLFPI